jgi:hypothetical protein
MSRIETLMCSIEKDRYIDQMNNRDKAVTRCGEILADLQKRYDHLAGVPATSLTPGPNPAAATTPARSAPVMIRWIFMVVAFLCTAAPSGVVVASTQGLVRYRPNNTAVAGPQVSSLVG